MRPSIVFLLFISFSIIPTQAYFSSIASAIEEFFTNDETGGFDNDVPKMLESMILSGEIHKYVDHEAIEKLFDPTRRLTEQVNRRLQTNPFNIENVTLINPNKTLDLRPCDELIFTFTPQEVRDLMKQYFKSLLGDLPFIIPINAYIDLRYKFGFAAYKICASCAELRGEYGGIGTFDSYCGEGKHGADANVSGLLYIPVDENKEFKECESNLAVWNRWIEWFAEECPSEQFFNGTDWGENVDEFESKGYTPTGFLTAGIGVVTLLPDYIGFGESYRVPKGPGVKSVYQTGIVPLILKARDTYVEQVTGGKTKVTNYVITSGYSEGAQPAVASGIALDGLGIGLRVRTQAGGGALDHVSTKGVLHLFAGVCRGDLIGRYKPIVAGLGVSYSSTNNDLANTNQGQDFFAENVREMILSWYSGQGENHEENTLVDYFRPVDMAEVFNSDIYNMIMKGYDMKDEIQNTCESFSEENKTDKFCEATKQSHMIEEIVNTKQVINLCWSKEDELFLFSGNVPGFWDRIWNTKLRLIAIPSFVLFSGSSGFGSKHTVTGGYCTVLQALTFHRIFY